MRSSHRPTPMLRAALALLLMLPLMGARCSSESESAPAAAEAAAAASAEPASSQSSSAETESDFVAACLRALEWNRELCRCADRLSEAELSETARTFVIATLNEDETATGRMRGQLSFEDATSAGLFMVRAGRVCGENPDA
ncbi:MAG: hypothetical protein AAF624_04440 [Bacteroidota bacterium]